MELLDEGNTVPFITRYRKDQTGGLDEEPIRQIQTRLTKMRMLAERKQTILRSIESQGKLTEKLSKQIRAAGTAKRLEDLYLPYKPKKQTLATVARSRGLEPLALEILAAEKGCADLDARAADFVNPDREVPTAADALLGAGHIIAEQFSERAELRQRLREILQRTGKVVSTQVGGETKASVEKPSQGQMPQSSQPPTAEASEQPGAPATQAAEATPSKAAEKPPRQTSPPGEGEQAAGAQPPDEPSSGNDAEPDPPAQAGANETPTDAPQSEPSGQAQDNPAQTPEADPPAKPETQAEVAPPAETSSPTGSKNGSPSASEPPAEPSAENPQPQTDQPPAEPPAGDPHSKTDQPPAEPESEQPPAAKPAEPTPAAPGPQTPQVKAERKAGKKEAKKKAEEKRRKAFRDYFDYREEIKKIPPHRVLAINRGERAKVLRVKIDCDTEAMHQALEEVCVPRDHPHAEFLHGCARDALSRLVLPGLEREARRELTERAENHAVGVFARNLRNLLLQPPVRGHRVLAVDPGYRSGCKLAALDEFGNVIGQDVIYLVGRPERKDQARRTVADLIERFALTVVAIGNGTACRQTEDFFAELIAGELDGKDLAYVIVNEAGASVYSTSRVGREEFPDYDASLRGAISIGRRLQDPLSELVKIEPANIGVGLYQHDVKAKHLQVSLDEVVESCVNYVGVDVNTASPALLRYVSGLNQLTARRVHEHRLLNGPFRSRQQLREVPGFGEATFVQAAGFLKIAGGDNPLDATWIHPESYAIARRVLEKLGCTPADLTRKDAADKLAQQTGRVDVAGLAKDLEVGELLLKDILAQLARPGRDPREDLPGPVFKHHVLKLEDLTPGMELTGTVLNVVDFGAFVDIGLHDSGLVHVSQLADKFVRDPHDVIAVGDIVKVWVVEVDKQRRRVSLTMIPPGTRRAGGRLESKPADKRPADRGAASVDREKPRRPRPKSPPPRAKGAPRPRFKPKPPRKPITPITEEMKTGKEPMRSFSDLAQFFDVQKAPPERRGKRAKPKRGVEQPQAAQPQQPRDGAEEVPKPEDKAPQPAEELHEPDRQEPRPAEEIANPESQTEQPEAQMPEAEGAAAAQDEQPTPDQPQQTEDEPDKPDP